MLTFSGSLVGKVSAALEIGIELELVIFIQYLELETKAKTQFFIDSLK